LDEKNGGPLTALHVSKRGIFRLGFRTWGRRCWVCSKGCSHASPIFLRNLCGNSLRKASFRIQNAEGPQASCGTGKKLRYLPRNRYLTVSRSQSEPFMNPWSIQSQAAARAVRTCGGRRVHAADARRRRQPSWR